VDRDTIEELLGVRRRRAQQILSPFSDPAQRTHRDCGPHGAASASAGAWRAGEAAFYEQRRRQRLWREVQQERASWTETLPAFVEACNMPSPLFTDLAAMMPKLCETRQVPH
jgi:hypothetical protein